MVPNYSDKSNLIFGDIVNDLVKSNWFLWFPIAVNFHLHVMVIVA